MEAIKEIMLNMIEVEILLLKILQRLLTALYLSLSLLVTLLILCVVLLAIAYILLKLLMTQVPRGHRGKIHIAFFHPYCNAGGGGERVLWAAVKTIQQRYPTSECYIYTGDTDASPTQILDNAVRRFNISLLRTPQFIYLKTRFLVEDKYYPVFTLLLQSTGGFFLGLEALSNFKPDIFIDTMGYPFSYPLFRYIANCKVACYTHYPTISTDMLERVGERVEAHNNRGFIARSTLFSHAKLIYYRIFASLYGVVGRCAHSVMVNSTWTKNHIVDLWGSSCRVETVFPPCDVQSFLGLLHDDSDDMIKIVSIGQFRPEKDYPLQLKSFKYLLSILEPHQMDKTRLVLIGGVRNTEDQMRVAHLKELAIELGIGEKIVWKVNASFTELMEEVRTGLVGLHAMWNEHFGISIVECMAGGLLMVAHNSGGPKLDILKPVDGNRVGFLADDEISYAESIKTIISMSNDEKKDLRHNAQQSVRRFGVDVFEENLIHSLQHLIDPFRED